MGQEVANFISELAPANPLDTDQRRFGAYHLRLIKQVLQNSFPNVDSPLLLTMAELNQFVGFDVNAIDAATLAGQLPAFYRDAANINAGLLDDDRVQETNVTQHQAALAIISKQVSPVVLTRSGGFTLNSSMDENIVICDSAGTINITLAGGVLATGHSAGFIRRNTGAVNFLAGAGQTINTPLGTSIIVRHGKAVATYVETNTWELSGNL